MKYKVAVYAGDYLTLLELSERMEESFPSAEIMIFGSESLDNDISGSGSGMLISDLSRLSEADILIILSEPAEESNYITNFDGSIIDFAGCNFSDNAEVHRVYEPIRSILRNIAVPPELTSAVLQLPVCVFGKDGVEDLMRQTKNIFTFENSDNLVFADRIAFNVHFNPIGISNTPVGKTADDFLKAGGDISVRLSPLSTVFILDVFASDFFELKSEDGYVVPNGFFMASDISEHKEIFVIRRRSGFTFAGDYIRVSVEAVIKKFAEVSGL